MLSLTTRTYRALPTSSDTDLARAAPLQNQYGNVGSRRRGRARPYRDAPSLAKLLGIGATLQTLRCRSRTAALRSPCYAAEPRALESSRPARSSLLVLSIATVAFALCSLDIVAGNPVFGQLDLGAHEWVVNHLSVEQRVTSDTVSDILAQADLTLNGLCILALLAREEYELAAVLPIGAFGVGRLGKLVKAIIQRVRPSDIRPDFSFPSSHTNQFVFSLVFITCVVFPTFAAAQPETKKRGAAASEQRGGAAPSRWLLAGISTWIVMGSTRVLADAHWVSDTAAGALLGVAFAAAVESLLAASALVPELAEKDNGGS